MRMQAADEDKSRTQDGAPPTLFRRIPAGLT
jgi:hypothetical protein